MSDYYIWDKETDVVREVGDVIEWARYFEGDGTDANHRRVDEYILEDGTYISTVFLGLDHSGLPGAPLVFETMVFTGSDEHGPLGEEVYREQYSTPDEARDGHLRAVDWAVNRSKEDWQSGNAPGC